MAIAGSVVILRWLRRRDLVDPRQRDVRQQFPFNHGADLGTGFLQKRRRCGDRDRFSDLPDLQVNIRGGRLAHVKAYVRDNGFLESRRFR